MQRTVEQRYAVKFCVKLGKSGSETMEMLKTAYGNECMSRAQVFKWHKAFKNGREDVEDERRAGRPSTTKTEKNVDRVRTLLNTDRRLSVRLVADELGIPKTEVHEIVTDELQMRKVCAKLVPKVLSPGQLEHRVSVSRELLERLTNEPDFLQRVVTGDETWVFEYDPETKRQSAEWHTIASPRPKKAKMSKSKMKTMLIVFHDSKGIVHKEFVPQGQTVNKNFYKEVLGRLRKRIVRVRPEIATKWILHHDNAPSHTAFVVTEFLTLKGITTLPQPPYSPDLSPCDFFLFPRLKRNLKGQRFQAVEDIQRTVTHNLNSIQEKEFQQAYQQWQDRWKRCVAAGGAYFEEY